MVVLTYGGWWTVLSFDHLVMGIMLLDLQSKETPRQDAINMTPVYSNKLQPIHSLRFVMPVLLAPWAAVQKLPRHADLTATFPKPLLGPASCVTWMNKSWMDRIWGVKFVQCGTSVEGLLSWLCHSRPIWPICIGMFLSMFISRGCSMVFSKEDLRTCQLLKIYQISHSIICALRGNDDLSQVSVRGQGSQMLTRSRL